jgi:hypothetical protein
LDPLSCFSTLAYCPIFGVHYIENLPADTYGLKFELPDGLGFTLPNVGENDTIDSDVSSSGWTTSIFTLGATEWKLDVDCGAVPIPGAVWLLASGLIGIVGFKRKFQK